MALETIGTVWPCSKTNSTAKFQGKMKNGPDILILHKKSRRSGKEWYDIVKIIPDGEELNGDSPNGVNNG